MKLVLLSAACGVGKTTVQNAINQGKLPDGWACIGSDEVGLNWWDYAGTDHEHKYAEDGLARATEMAQGKNLLFPACINPDNLRAMQSLPACITEVYFAVMTCSDEQIAARLLARPPERMCGSPEFIASQVAYNDWLRTHPEKFTFRIDNTDQAVDKTVDEIANYLCRLGDEQKGGGQVILLNGPSSSGKSTLSKELQAFLRERMGMESAIVSIDDFMCKILGVDEPIYEDDVYEISGEMCSEILRLLASTPCVIVDHVITSPRIYSQLSDAVRTKKLLRVRIECPLEVLVAREKARGNRCAGSAESSYTYLYPKQGYDACVNTHTMTTAQCCEVILEKLKGE